ncbi:MAG: hypothetical protein AAF449_16270, partial [Myxococcota bacterium]
GTPVAALPRGYWPLAKRQSGFLVPEIRSHPAYGLSIGTPIYAVFGPSWDVTITPSIRSERGLAGAVEVRNHPALHVQGFLNLGIVYEDRREDEVAWPGEKGRLRASLFGRQKIAAHLADGFRFDVQLALLTDAGGNEFSDRFDRRQAEWTRSYGGVSGASGAFRWWGGGQYFQDLRPSTYPDQTRRRVSLFADPTAQAVRQRALEVRFDHVPRSSWPIVDRWTVWSTMRTSAQLFAALDRSSPQFVRTDQRATMGMHFRLPAGFVASLQSTGRLTVWSGEALHRFRFAPRWFASLNQTLGRAYGQNVHRIRSTLEGVWIPAVVGTVPGALATHDELDALAARMQVRARLTTDFVTPAGRVFLMGMGGYEDRWAPFTVRGGFDWSLQPFRMSAELVSYWPIDDVGSPAAMLHANLESTRLRAQLTGLVLGQMPPSMWFVAPEELIPSNALDAGAVVGPSQIALWATADYDWPSITVGLQVGISSGANEDALETAYPGGSRSPLRTLGGRLVYRSACQCWSASVAVRYDRDLSAPSVSLGFSLGL